MREGDLLLMITADHGCDPTTSGTEHSREFRCWSMERERSGASTWKLEMFTDIGTTLADIFHVPKPRIGISFYDSIRY
jgi:phosphopentomutase